jgi:hypothetical protein
LNATQIKRYREGIADVVKGLDFTHCLTCNLWTSCQTIQRGEEVAKNLQWNLNREAFTRKGLRNGRRLVFFAVLQGHEGFNLHLHCAIGGFNKHHNEDSIRRHCENATDRTVGIWKRPLTMEEKRAMKIERPFDFQPLWDKSGWIDYILRENNADRTYDKPFLDTRDADRILIGLISQGN